MNVPHECIQRKMNKHNAPKQTDPNYFLPSPLPAVTWPITYYNNQ